MKIIKKITAMMLSIMMVLGMCSVVSAAGTTETGTITINNAISGQTYKIYKILTLESYDKTDGKNLYSYKPADDKWKTFFETGDGKDYASINENGYVEWNVTEGETEAQKEAKAAELAQKALAYATKEGSGITATDTKDAAGDTVEFVDLDLGYYLVDSSLGTLCGLDTTNPTAIIKEKNDKPTVEKQVYDVDAEEYKDFNNANIGDTVTFMTTVHVKKGAYNYIVYDEMSKGFKLNENSTEGGVSTTIHIFSNDIGSNEPTQDDYEVTVYENKKGFKIEFKNTFLERYKDTEYDIFITYAATLTGDATIGKNSGNTNTAWVTYGDKNTKSKDSVTNTYTFGIPVFKYTGTDTALAGAKFSLYSEETCVDANRINLIKVDETETYRRFITGDADASKVTDIITTATGEFNITGLKPGTYYLKEIAAPKGYNLLAAPTKVEVTSEGKIKVNSQTGMVETDKVKVLNKSGSILPSTGGIGTTIFYIAGALLVLAAGVVLIAKKRTDSK